MPPAGAQPLAVAWPFAVAQSLADTHAYTGPDSDAHSLAIPRSRADFNAGTFAVCVAEPDARTDTHARA